MVYDTAVKIGSGGMGEVFKAWDPDLERHVALKYLRSNEPELVERLLREARAQARVDHPGVCKVYEVGSDDGRPYIAMQFVEGRPLIGAAADLNLEQKVLLVQQVAEAVQAAHAAGLIHRDLKPGNILVGETDDGQLRPWVLDFGIAREREVAGLTATGQVLGTPGYLSPEQARGETTGLDRRTDVFSLGVVLYELLSGEMPFEGDSSVEVLVSLLEDEPVPLSKRELDVPRDLETVVMTCLEKEPERRYPSARALADDLQRFLAGEPVEARPITRLERLRRLARRHRVASVVIAVASVVVLALLILLAGSWVKYTVDLRRERDLAEARAVEARQTADFLTNIFKAADPELVRGESITARDLLAQGAERVRSELPDRPLVRAHLMHLLGEIHWKLGLYDEAEDLLTGALAIREAELDPDHLDIAASLSSLGVLYGTLGRFDEAEAMFRRLVAIRSNALGPDHPQVADGLTNLGLALHYLGRYEEAMAVTRRVLEIRERILEPGHWQIGNSYLNLGLIQARLGRYEDAEQSYTRSLAIMEQALGRDHPRVASTLNNLGTVLRDLGRNEEAVIVLRRAVEVQRKVLGGDHPDLARSMSNLGTVLRNLERYEEAEEVALKALQIRERAFGPDHEDVATSYGSLGRLYAVQGKLDRAERSYLRSLELQENAGRADHPDIGYVLLYLSELYLKQGRMDEARAAVGRTLTVWEAGYGTDSANLIPALERVADLDIATDDLESAARALERAVAISVSARGEEHEATRALRERLGRLVNGT